MKVFPVPKKMVPVFSIHNGESSWKWMLAFFSPEGKKFYWTSDSGCECCKELTSQVKDTDSMNSGDAKELKQAIRVFINDNPNLVTEDEKRTIFSKIKNKK